MLVSAVVSVSCCTLSQRLLIQTSGGAAAARPMNSILRVLKVLITGFTKNTLSYEL